MTGTTAADEMGMAQSQVGSAADEASPGAGTIPATRDSVPQRSVSPARTPRQTTADDQLLEAIRARPDPRRPGRRPAHPLARARRPRPVGGHVVRRAPAAHSS